MDDAVSSPAPTSKYQKGFLSLPRELRDLVYEESLFSDIVAPPSSPEEAGPRLTVATGTKGIFYQCICYPSHHGPRAAGEGLFLSNRQIQAEIQQSRTLDYRLDIMVECFGITTGWVEGSWNNLKIWPTWTLYPLPVSNIRELCVDIRVFGPFPIDGGFPLACTPLLLIVNRLIHYGPQFVYKGPSHSKVHIETLTVNLTHDGGSFSGLSLFNKLFRGISLFAHTGAFTGIISKIRVRSGESCEEVNPEYLRTERPNVAQIICRHGLFSLIDRMKHDGDHSSIVWGIEMSSKFAS